ncbi:hypothetical protein Tco_1201514 [Tanacetum coccineum]
MEIHHSKANTPRGAPFDETRAEETSDYVKTYVLLSTQDFPPRWQGPQERRRQVQNEDLRAELEYYNEEYDEEREMEPRPVRARATTLVLRTRSPRVRRHRGRVVEFEDAPNMDGSRVEKESDGRRPSKRRVKMVEVVEETFLHYSQPTWKKSERAPMSNYGHNHNVPMYPLNVPPTSYPFYDPTGLFADSAGCVTPFVCWIEDYPLPDGLKMPSHVGSYDGKGNPDNYLHLFESSFRSIVNYEDLKEKFRSHFSQQKKFMKTHLAVYNIKQKDSLVKFLSTDLPTTYKGLIEKTYTWIEEKEVATNGAPNDHKEGFNRFNKESKENSSNREGRQNLQQPPRMVKNRRSCDMSEYCHFHEDHEHETNQCWELRHQIKEAVKSGQLTHLVKGIKKGKAKASDTQLGEWKKGDKDIIPVEALILMISRESQASKRKSAEGPVNGIGAHLPPVVGFDNSSGPVIITVQISKRQVNRYTWIVVALMKSSMNMLPQIKAFHQIT